MNASCLAGDARLQPLGDLGPGWLDRLVRLAQQVHSHPWSRGNFADALHAGYSVQLLIGPPDELIGYFVAMQVLDEAHLLDIAVAPQRQRQGWARFLLTSLGGWARARQARCLWLEVREGNARARHVYAACGWRPAGLRKDYYPLHGQRREHAVLMKWECDRET